MKLPSYRNPKRPLLGERQQFDSKIRWVIEQLNAIYIETPNEKLLDLIDNLKGTRAQEDAHRIDELREFWANVHDFPSAVVIWMAEYRDKEME